MISYRILALVFVICGIVLFSQFADQQQDVDAKLHRIKTGEVQPETLTVISKQARGKKSAAAWVTFRSDRVKKFVYPAPRTTPADRQRFDALDPGSSVTGYYFAEGYFIPQLQEEHDAATSKWVFLGGCLSMAAVSFAISFGFKKKPQVTANP